MKKIFILLFLPFLFTSCEKVIDLDYKSNQSRIIIEGNITNEAGPYFVKITKSVALSETGNYPTIDDALVVISDDAGGSETLIAQGSGLYRTSALAGTEGRTYTLTVMAEGKTYTAQSTMPQRVVFDSIRVGETTLFGEAEYNLIPVYEDPIAKGNQYRFVLTINDKLLNLHLMQNDDVRNGLVNTVMLEIGDEDLEPQKGDRVSIQMQCIDKNIALYYTTLALIADSGPGGGTTPNNAPNNISNGALGIFSAHTTEVKSVTIP